MGTRVLRNARLLGSDAVTDVTLRGGSIVALGSAAVAGAEAIDLEGRWVMPGLWDHHVHFTQWAIVRTRLDVSAAPSAAAVGALVAARVEAESDDDALLIGQGYRDIMWPDEPTAEVLDHASPTRPVVLVSGDLHACWVNSSAQRRLGLPHAGVVREDVAFQVQMGIQALSPEQEDAVVADAVVAAAARGVVGVIDMEMADNLGGWRRRAQTSPLGLRVRSGFYPDELDARIGAGWRTRDVVPDTAGRLVIGPLKMITDGSLNTRTAYCHEPYPGSTTRGQLTISPEDCEGLLSRAKAHGFSVAVHAIGDAAVTHALDAFDITGATGSIEHAQLVAESDLPRFGELGVVASVQPEHLWDDRDPTDRIWPDRAHRAFPFGALRDAGATLWLGSDAPVSPLDPWRAIAAAVHRSSDEREPWHAHHSLTVEEALRASAPLLTVVEGAPADLVALDENPLSAGADALADTHVALTIMDGDITHDAR